MGNNNAPNQINAKNYNAENQSNSQDNSKHLLQQALNQIFQNGSINGSMNRDVFNESLILLEKMNLRRLRDTPLGINLFQLFDKDNSQGLSQSEFLKGFTNVMNDQEIRIIYTFKIYDRDNDKIIKRKEFVKFLEDCWKCAFKILGTQLEAKKQNTNLKEVNHWANSQLSHIQKEAESMFCMIKKSDKDSIDFQTFKQWILQQPNQFVTAQYMDEKVEIPITLYAIEH